MCDFKFGAGVMRWTIKRKIDGHNMKMGSKKQMVAWGIACAVSFIFYYQDLGPIMGYLIPIPILAIVFMTTKTYIQYKGSMGIEKLKPICIALFAVWWHGMRLFGLFPVDDAQRGMMNDWYTSIILLLIAVLSITYLAMAGKRRTKKYPAVICLVMVLILFVLWNLETL